MNGWLELRIITQPYSAVYWGYFCRLIFGNSLTKHIKLSSFSYSVVIFFLPISHIPPCFHANPPDFPRLIGPRVLIGRRHALAKYGQCMFIIYCKKEKGRPLFRKGWQTCVRLNAISHQT